MAKIVLEITADSRAHREYHSFASAAVTVGRGLDNDVILSDPYVSSRHLLVERDGAGLKVLDRDSENGMYVNGVKHLGGGVEVPSGEEILIGKTRLRIYLEEHPVPPARVLVERSPLYKLAGKPAVAWGLLLAVAGLALLEAHWNTTKNESLLKLLPSPIGVLSSVLVWAGLWTFIGRLLRHRMCFLEHVSVCGLWFLSSEILDNVVHYVSFYANSKPLGTALGYAVNSGIFIVTLFATLTFATNMTPRKKMVFAGVFTGILVLSFAGLRLSVAEYYAWEPPYDTVLEPPVFGVPKARSVPDFVGRTDRLFAFKDLEKAAGE